MTKDQFDRYTRLVSSGKVDRNCVITIAEVADTWGAIAYLAEEAIQNK